MGNPTVATTWRKKRVLVDKPTSEESIKNDCAADHPLPCPGTGSNIFGHVPQMQVRGGPLFPEGHIQLHYGAHYGPNRGFGFQHIWAEHYRHIQDHDGAMAEIAKAIQAILKPTTDIFYVPPKERVGKERASVFRLSAGLVIIELRDGTNPFYSVVTGGFNPGEKKGTLIGALV